MRTSSNKFTSLSALPLLFSLSSLSWSGVTHSIQHTATTVKPHEYEVRTQLDLLMSRGGGVNVSGHFRTGLVEDQWDIEGFAGTGKTDFKTGVLSQFNLLPDLPGQIGLAFLGGYTLISDDYRRNGDRDILHVLSLTALGSKRFDVSFGEVTPYGGLQVELLFKSGDHDFPITAVLGNEWKFSQIHDWRFFSEFDIDVSDSVFLFGLGAAYRF
jgi:hypothetical protein